MSKTYMVGEFMRNYCVAAFLVGALNAIPASAQSDYLVVAKGTEGLIKSYDRRVRDVKSVIPAPPGGVTACGKIGEGSLTAFYCPQSRSIYITDRTLQAVGSSYGPEGVAVVVAHEFAHARQHAIQGFTSTVIWSSVIDEVQADCVAGVYLKAATPIPISNKMLHNSAKLLENIGDYMPLERDWHGTPEMRKTAFLHGYAEGALSSCVASDDTNVNQIIKKSSDILQNQLDNPQSELNRLIRWGNNILQN